MDKAKLVALNDVLQEIISARVKTERLINWSATLRQVLVEMEIDYKDPALLHELDGEYFYSEQWVLDREKIYSEYKKKKEHFATVFLGMMLGYGVFSVFTLLLSLYRVIYALGKKMTLPQAEGFHVDMKDSTSITGLLTAKDEEWIKEAVEDEMRYVTKFEHDILNDNIKMSVDARVNLYVKALDSVFLMGQLSGISRNVHIFWNLGIAEHCEDCLTLARNSPYTIDTLPTVPRNCATQCLCITTPESRVLTRKGWKPISEIQVGEEVLTHLKRWKKVLATPRHYSNAKHQQAQILTPTGKVLGCTSDHKFLTQLGWKSVFEVAKLRLQMYTLEYENMQKMSTEDAYGSGFRQLQGMQSDLRKVWPFKGSQSDVLSKLQYAHKSTQAMARPEDGKSYSSWTQDRRVVQTKTLWRPSTRTFCVYKMRWAQIRNVLGLRQRNDSLHIPLSLDMGTKQRSNTRRYVCTSQKWGLYRRPTRKLRTFVQTCSRYTTLYRSTPGQVATRQRISTYRRTRLSMQDMRAGILEKAQSRLQASSSILFSRMPEKTLLYDLTVEDDHSFIIEGLIAHNSNCKCFLHFKVVE